MKNQDHNIGTGVNTPAQKTIKSINRLNNLYKQGILMCVFALCSISTFAQDKPKATSDYTTTILVSQTPKEAFDAINNVRGWWSENIIGGTHKLNDEFTYQRTDLHKCTMKLIEVIPNKKVVWLVLDNYFSFTKDKTEWVGTKIEFEISEKDGKTQILFTHHGLVPAYECYNICFDAWTSYLKGSLKDLITTGKGHPNPKENDNVNSQLIKKLKLGQ